jgi:hypothetical protein
MFWGHTLIFPIKKISNFIPDSKSIPGSLPLELMNAPLLLFPRDTFTCTVETGTGAGVVVDEDAILMIGLRSSSSSSL